MGGSPSSTRRSSSCTLATVERSSSPFRATCTSPLRSSVSTSRISTWPGPSRIPHRRAVDALSPLTADPTRARRCFCDVDGTLAPIVQRAEDATCPRRPRCCSARLSRRYALVACISGRAAADARRLVGVGGIAYAGSHGAELLEPGASTRACCPASPSWEPAGAAVRARARHAGAARAARADRGQGPDHGLPLARRARRGRARTRAASGSPQEAEAAGLSDPLGAQGARDPAAGPVGQGPGGARAARRARPVRAALFARRRRDRPGRLRRARRAGREGGSTPPCASACAPTRARARSSSGPTSSSTASRLAARCSRRSPAHEVPRLPARVRAALRRRRHGARDRLDRRRHARGRRARSSTSPRSGGAWRPLVGLWLGRRPETTEGIGDLLADARTTTSLPELEPGAVDVQPAVAAGRARPCSRARSASSSRRCRRSRPATLPADRARLAAPVGAVEAIEDRDGVAFYFDRSSPFGPPQLLRTPGLRRLEPTGLARAAALAQLVELGPGARVRRPPPR